MINLVYGKVKGTNPPRVTVQLTGIEGDSELECMLLQLGGQSNGQRQWTAPLEGDIVAVLYDSERPEVSLILGGVYSDTQEVPQGDGVAIQTKNVDIDANSDINVKSKNLYADVNKDIFTDSKSVYISASSVFSVHSEVKLGKNINVLQKAAKAGSVNDELLAIKSALDALVASYNSHVHTTTTPLTSTPTSTAVNTYINGDVSCASVSIN